MPKAAGKKAEYWYTIPRLPRSIVVIIAGIICRVEALNTEPAA